MNGKFKNLDKNLKIFFFTFFSRFNAIRKQQSCCKWSTFQRTFNWKLYYDLKIHLLLAIFHNCRKLWVVKWVSKFKFKISKRFKSRPLSNSLVSYLKLLSLLSKKNLFKKRKTEKFSLIVFILKTSWTRDEAEITNRKPMSEFVWF